MKAVNYFKKMLFLLLVNVVSFSIFAAYPVKGQGNKSQLEVRELIQQLEEKFEVSIMMDASLLEQKELTQRIADNASQIIAASGIEQSLRLLVKGLNLEYRKMNDAYYIIKEKNGSLKTGKQSAAPQGEKKKKIEGVVISAKDKLPIPGVTVLIIGMNTGTATDFDGRFELEIPEGAKTVVFSFIGMKKIEMQVKDLKPRGNIIKMQEDYFGLDEVVISGVAAATPQKNLTVTVKRVDTKAMQGVQSSSAISALQGRVGGLQIINGSGKPGGSVGIKLRGASSINGSIAPLIMIDGIIVRTSLSDINFDDIESYEIVEGAAASALYGSRAANGVIVLKTKRGSQLKAGSVLTTVKAEYGFQELPKHIPLATHHPYRLADDWEDYDYTRYWHVLYNDEGEVISGSRSMNNPDSSYVDQPYRQVHDFQKEIFQKGVYYSTFASIAAKQKKMNYFISFEHNKQEGIFKYTKGYSRNNFTLTLDNYLTDKVKLSASTHLISTLANDPGNIYYATFGMMAMSPDVNLIDSVYPDGSLKMSLYPDPWQRGVVENPLIPLYYVHREKHKNSFFGNVDMKYDIFDFLSADIKYSYEYRYSNSTKTYPLGYMGSSGYYSDGYYSDNNFSSFSQEIQPIINFNQKIEDLLINTKLSFKYESYQNSNKTFDGRNFTAADLEVFQNFDPATIGGYSTTQKIVSEDFFAITDLNFKDTYMFSGLIRRDGSSLFGENERWQTYYRISGAVRLSNFIQVPWLNEMKLSSAYGIAGLRPNFYQQYETWSIYNGMLFPHTQGNKNLRPAVSKEWEMSLNMAFFDRFNSQTTYSIGRTDGALFLVPQPSQFGFPYQWQNIGGVSSRAFSSTLDAQILNKKHFQWNAGLTFSTVFEKIDELGVPEFYQGPNSAFLVRDNEIHNVIYGYDWVRTLDQMSRQLPEGASINDYEVNDEGYVVPRGSIGTNMEKAIPLDADNNGVKDKVIIGEGNPDFIMDFSNTISLFGVEIGCMLSWKQGGDIYNYSRQYLYRDLRAAEIDQYGKPDDQKKSLYYYQNFYSNTEINSYFVEDGSYLKIRELSLSYNLPDISKIFGKKTFVKGFRIGVQGRNLFTFTGYKGFDPEVAYRINGHYFPFDRFTYPNFRTYTFSLRLQF